MIIPIAIVDVTSRTGELLELAWLERAEQVHRQLRPQLPPEYVPKMQRVFAGGGRMVLATEAETVRGVAVWRSYENTFVGRQLYVDDLVTDAAHRSRGVGRALLGHCERIARELRCVEVVLDSGVQRADAHRFYFREGYTIGAFNFSKALGAR